jgi:uncharacterized protein YkwD
MPNQLRVLRRALALLCLAATVSAALAAGATASTNRIDRLLAPVQVCPGSDRADRPRAVEMDAMACLVGYLRSRAGLPVLRLSGTLGRAASLKVDADLRCGEFSHTPCGSAFLSVFSEVGYARGSSSFAVGENLAWGGGQRGAPRRVMQVWLHSPEHLENLLSHQWREFGLGVSSGVDFLGYHGATIWANEFGSHA